MIPNSQRPVLVVRLSNWIGDVVLTLPSLVRLSEVYELRLVGKGWMPKLLAAYGWGCYVYPKKTSERVALLRGLKQAHRATTALCFPTSFSSALEFRLAGLPAVGYAKEGRSWLLRRALPVPPASIHMAEHFSGLANCLLPPAERVGGTPSATLRLSDLALSSAKSALLAAGVPGDFVAVCPFSSGAIGGQSKDWPGFGELVQRLTAAGHRVVACPGPGEELQLAERWPSLTPLPGLGVDVYAAVLSLATAVVANDTGPGHLAAAVGVPLWSVLGPTDPARWGPRGPQVHLLREWPHWPTADALHQHLLPCLPKPQPLKETA